MRDLTSYADRLTPPSPQQEFKRFRHDSFRLTGNAESATE